MGIGLNCVTAKSSFLLVKIKRTKSEEWPYEQKQEVKDNIMGMGLNYVATKSPSLRVKIKRMKSEEWPYGCVDLVMAILDNIF